MMDPLGMGAAQYLPVFSLKHDIVRTVEDIAAQILGSQGGRPRLPESVLRRYGVRRAPLVEGDDCCLKSQRSRREVIQHLVLPHDYTCTCGRIWTIRMEVVS